MHTWNQNAELLRAERSYDELIADGDTGAIYTKLSLEEYRIRDMGRLSKHLLVVANTAADVAEDTIDRLGNKRFKSGPLVFETHSEPSFSVATPDGIMLFDDEAISAHFNGGAGDVPSIPRHLGKIARRLDRSRHKLPGTVVGMSHLDMMGVVRRKYPDIPVYPVRQSGLDDRVRKNIELSARAGRMARQLPPIENIKLYVTMLSTDEFIDRFAG